VFPRHNYNLYRCVVLWLVLFLWVSVIREDIAVSWGKQWGFVIIDTKYVFMNILLKVFYQEETVHSLLSVQNWQEILQSKRILLSIVYLIRCNVYYRHTCLVKVFHTYPHLAQSLKQYKYETNRLHVSIHWAFHSVHIQKWLTVYYFNI
jgi:hypothetical protein